MLKTENNSLLSAVDVPQDLRKLNLLQLPHLCGEIREFIIDHLAKNPGHFASSLGTVELTVALHYVFNTPHDRIVWDVGHQAYTHKIITGRKDRFETNRKLHGLSGFPSPKESIYDTFSAGHASNSISAALGMAVASKIIPNNQRHVIAVIGDASIGGGLAFEGLNNASSSENDMLIILNDNNMAIDSNVGGLNQYLVNINTSTQYNRIRFELYKTLRRINFITEERKGSIIRFNNSIKSFLTRQHNIFDGLNIRYFGPIDGHDTQKLVNVLEKLKHLKGPKILHVITKKGKGFKPAEEEATVWHAPGKFNKETGERIVASTDHLPPLFQDVFGDTLVELAEVNPKIVGVTPAMPSGCSMNRMIKRFPERSFDVGIAEEHAVTFSAGMAKEGLIPFCNIYSTFMQRAYGQVIHDVALQQLPVIFCLDRAGLVGEDGPTHHGVLDLTYFRTIPHVTVSAPLNEIWLRNLMYTAQKQNNGPFMIRYPRGRGVLTDWRAPLQEVEIGKGYCLEQGEDIALLSIGFIGNAARAAVHLAQKEGVNPALFDMVFVKPLDEELLHQVMKKYPRIITLEEHTVVGGFGSAILEFMAKHQYTNSIKVLGVKDEFITHGTVPQLHEICGLTPEQIKAEICLNWSNKELNDI